jgi:hypothetical protein
MSVSTTNNDNEYTIRNPNGVIKSPPTKSDSNTEHRQYTRNVSSEYDLGRAEVVARETHVWNDRDGELDPKTGYPIRMSQLEIDKLEARNKLKLKYAPADHTKLFDTMFYFLGVSTEPLNKVKENLNAHRYNLESDRDYRQADLEDLQKPDSSRSNIKNLIRRYKQEVKPVIDEIEKEIARYEDLEKETS